MVLGAHWFTESAVWIARRSGISQVAIGATLVSLATTLPESSVSIYAASSGHTQLAIGNALGSAIANIGLILGFVTLVRRQELHRRPFFVNSAFLLLAALVLTSFAQNGVLGRGEAVLMLMMVALFITTSLRMARHLGDRETGQTPNRTEDGFVLPIFLFMLGAAMITAGGKLLVNSGVTIAEGLGVPPLIVGLTAMALGTSLPELVTALTATLKGHQNLGVGNLVGASFLNLTLVSGAASLVRPLPVAPTNLRFDFPVIILMGLLLLSFGLKGRTLHWWMGALLLGMYILYVTTLLTVFT